MAQLEMEGEEIFELWVEKKKAINDAVMEKALKNGVARY